MYPSVCAATSAFLLLASPQISDARTEAGRLYDRAAVAFRAWAFEEALDAYAKVVELCPAHPRMAEILARMGDSLFRLGRIEEALVRYRECIQKYPTGSGREYVQHRLADCLVRLGKIDEAREAYARALALYRGMRFDVERRIARLRGERTSRPAPQAGRETLWFEDGRPARWEQDCNLDGKIDLWVYFEAGKLDRLGVDGDGDGLVDTWMALGPGREAGPGETAAASGLGRIRKAQSEIEGLVERARRARDVIMLNCTNEKLVATKGLAKVAERALEEAGSEDPDLAEHGRAKLGIAADKAEVLAREAARCIGERAPGEAARIEVEIDPGSGAGPARLSDDPLIERYRLSMRSRSIPAPGEEAYLAVGVHDLIERGVLVRLAVAIDGLPAYSKVDPEGVLRSGSHSILTSSRVQPGDHEVGCKLVYRCERGPDRVFTLKASAGKAVSAEPGRIAVVEIVSALEGTPEPAPIEVEPPADRPVSGHRASTCDRGPVPGRCTVLGGERPYLWIHRAEDGSVSLIEQDSDLDGRIDTWRCFEGQRLQRVERDGARCEP